MQSGRKQKKTVFFFVYQMTGQIAIEKQKKKRNSKNNKIY